MVFFTLVCTESKQSHQFSHCQLDHTIKRTSGSSTVKENKHQKYKATAVDGVYGRFLIECISFSCLKWLTINSRVFLSGPIGIIISQISRNDFHLTVDSQIKHIITNEQQINKYSHPMVLFAMDGKLCSYRMAHNEDGFERWKKTKPTKCCTLITFWNDALPLHNPLKWFTCLSNRAIVIVNRFVSN